MEKQLKNSLIVVGFGVTLFVALFRIDDLAGLLGRFVIVWKPVLEGCLIAFVLNVPMVKVDNWLHRRLKNRKKPINEVKLQAISLTITVILLVAIFSLLGVLVIPPLIASVSGVIQVLQVNVPLWTRQLQGMGIDADWINTAYSALKKAIAGSSLGSGLDGFINTLISRVSGTLGNVFNWLIALIIAIYLLVGKKDFHRHCVMAAHAFLPEKAVHATGKVWRMICVTYSQFFSGQCVEACILGGLMFTAFMIARLPYAGLVAVLTAVSSFIPYIGSFLSCAIGAVLIFLISPVQALVSIIVYQVVQFCENQFIYPRVVGGAVGLPPLWTLVAVLVGGNLAGLLGMLFCIPFTSVLYTLLGDLIRARYKHKNNQNGEEASEHLC